MTSLRNRERILEAIDQLRRRKARPDFQRISNYLFRRFAVNSSEARADLERCVADNHVLKVEYKGSISYRNAAKKNAQAQMRHKNHTEQSRTKPPPPPPTITNASNNKNNSDDQAGGVAANSPGSDNYKTNRQFNELLTNAFGELIVYEPDYLETGVPSGEIIANILAKDSVRYTKKYLSILLEKEVDAGRLIKTQDGSYLMGPSKEEEGATERKKRTDRDVIVGADRNHLRSNHNHDSHHHDNHGNFVTVVKIEGGEPATVEFERQVKSENVVGMDSTGNSVDKKKSDGLLRTGGRRKVSALSCLFFFCLILILLLYYRYVNTVTSVNCQKQIVCSLFCCYKSANNFSKKMSKYKRAKKVFDPSDNHVPKKRGRPVGSLNRSTIEKHLARLNNEEYRENRPDSRTSSNGRDQGGVCSVCHLQNRKGPNDRMVACRECSNKAHIGCLNGDDMMLKMYPDNTWQCPHCKTCVVCFETSDAGNLIVCSVCADGYHASCHQPRITEKIRNGQKWLCTNCHMPDELKINAIQSNINSFSRKSSLVSDANENTSSNSGVSSPSNYVSPSISPTPPQLSPQTGLRSESPDADARSDSQSLKEDYEEDNIDPSIPDATHWTVEEVYQYFYRYFPEEAEIFKEQEIDGRSLLLLKRLDVLTNLNLRLGPALKIYKHIVKLQVRRDDPRLYWL
ncbi:unnamed protein product [Phyllotreta striolata]|uniref:Uncharacterized protein n=1 Tax=Phyllotreta striolata TaxID=444603 RepID=A0A9N9XTD3_PHYSR|nr:unnamed protein product [Phyllotreta striolata]